MQNNPTLLCWGNFTGVRRGQRSRAYLISKSEDSVKASKFCSHTLLKIHHCHWKLKFSNVCSSLPVSSSMWSSTPDFQPSVLKCSSAGVIWMCLASFSSSSRYPLAQHQCLNVDGAVVFPCMLHHSRRMKSRLWQSMHGKTVLPVTYSPSLYWQCMLLLLGQL